MRGEEKRSGRYKGEREGEREGGRERGDTKITGDKLSKASRNARYTEAHQLELARNSRPFRRMASPR